MTRQKSKKYERKLKKSHHHIIPRSRGGTDRYENIAAIDIKAHQNYHTLFGNMTPEEIIDYLVNYFWKGNYNFLEGNYETGK